MSLGGGSTSIHTEEPRVLSLRVSQSAYGAALARVWGTQRVAGNVIWYGDFTAIPHTTTTSSGGGGGKGGGGGVESTNTSYTYTAAFAMALCSGSIVGVGTVWQDKTKTTIDALGLTLKTGTLGQAVWSHLASNHPDQAVGYSGIAYVASASFDLGAGSSIPNVTFEVRGERVGANGDAKASDIVYDIVADPVEGLGWSPAILGDTANYDAWCAAMGLTLSLAATAQKPARDYLSDIGTATLSEYVWSQGVLKIVPYGDHPIDGWTPNTTPVFDIGEGDLLRPPRHNRKQPADAVNRVTVNHTSRDNDYNSVPVMREDLTAVTQFGARPKTYDLPAIPRGDMAATVCEFWRDRELYIRNTWELDVDERFCNVEPMDLGTLTFGPHSLYQVPVCVVWVEESGDGEMTIAVEEWPFGIARPTVIPVAPPSGYVPQEAVAPGAVVSPVIFEAPAALTVPNHEVWIAAAGGVNWGGANVWISDDNARYQRVGVIANPARYGALASLLPAGDDPDTNHTLDVDLSASNAQIISGTQADADGLNTLCWVDGELIAYETATLTAPHRYSLTYLRRGAKGTANATHTIGARFVRLDGAVFRYAVPRERIGRTVWVKLQSFNHFGLATEPLDTVVAYDFAIGGNKPLPLASLTAIGGMFENKLQWTFAANQVGIDYVEIWGATENNRNQALPLTAQKHPVDRWKHPGLAPGQDWYYWARVVDTSTNQGDFHPASATDGIHAAPSSDPSNLLQQLQNAVGLDQLADELAKPIVVDLPAATAGNAANAIAAIQSALDQFDLATRMDWQETVTNALVTVDPVTGRIQLLATANVTTDVESRLAAAELLLNADTATLQAMVATLATVQGDLTATQSALTLAQGQLALTASSVYVDNAVATAFGQLDTEAANAAQALALAAIQDALDVFNGQQDASALKATVAVAQDTLTTQADALGSLATRQSALVATVAGAIASIAGEQTARANQDGVLAQSISVLSATVTGNKTTTDAAIAAEQTARANADSAEATARTALAARVTSAEGNITAAAAAISSEQTARANGDSALANSISSLTATVNSNTAAISSEQTARANGDSALANSINSLTATVNGNTAAISSEQTARANGDSALSSSISSVSARLNTGGDVANSIASVTSQASASASAITGLQSQYVLQVNAGGKIAGMQLASGGGQASIVFLADKFLICKPDGSGTPKQVLILGTVNGVSALGLDGNLLVDGSVVARTLAANSVTAANGAIENLAVERIKIANHSITDVTVAGSLSGGGNIGGYSSVQLGATTYCAVSYPETAEVSAQIQGDYTWWATNGTTVQTVAGYYMAFYTNTNGAGWVEQERWKVCGIVPWMHGQSAGMNFVGKRSVTPAGGQTVYAQFRIFGVTEGAYGSQFALANGSGLQIAAYK